MELSITYVPATADATEGVIVRDGKTPVVYRRHGAHDWRDVRGWRIDPALDSAAEYLSWKADGEAFAAVHRNARLEALRAALRAENISYGELAELQSLAAYIAPGDVELLEAAGVPEGTPRDIEMKMFIDRFDADGKWYIFDEADSGNEAFGPFDDYAAAARKLGEIYTS